MIHFISMSEVILKMMELKVIECFTQSIDALKRLVIAIIFHLKYCLIKVLNQLLHLTIVLLPCSINYINTEIRVKFNESCLKQEEITFTHKKVVNIYIVYEINLWSFTREFTL